MTRRNDIQIVLAAPGQTFPAALMEAMRRESWTISQAGGMDELLALAGSGRYHMAVVAIDRQEQMPPLPLRDLLAVQEDVAVIILTPDPQALRAYPGFGALTSDQVFALGEPTESLMTVLKAELESVLAAQPSYTVMCVDDDTDFLASLEQLLPERLDRDLPRFRLHYDFYLSPLEALAAAEEMPAGRLALVVSDQVMPDIKGVDFLRRIKQRFPDTQRILLTGYAGLDSAVVAINEQVLDKYLTKPIEEPVGFINTLKNLIGKYHLRDMLDIDRRRLAAQFELLRLMSTMQKVDEILHLLTGYLREQTAAQRVAVLLLESGGLAVRAIDPRMPEATAAAPLVREDEASSWLSANRRPFIVTSADQIPFDPAFLGAGAQPLLVTPLMSRGTPLGAVMLLPRPDGHGIGRAERLSVSFAADMAAVALAGLQDRLALEEHYVATMASLMDAVEAKDRYTRGHTERVSRLALAMGRKLNLSERDLKDLVHAASLHDVGKIAVPDSIIAKPGRLSPEEFDIMKGHPVCGDHILHHLRFLNRARLILRSHHERYDGTGYPDGLRGEEIPLGARILSLADSFDAMTSARPYRPAMNPPQALREIEQSAGKQFDPKLVERFVQMIRESTPPSRSVKTGAANGQREM